MTEMNRDSTVFIDGEWEGGRSPSLLAVVNPADGLPATEIRTALPDDVDRAAASAKRAFRGWTSLAAQERAIFLRGFARGLERRASGLLTVQMTNNGKPRLEAEIDLADAVATFDYYADLAENPEGFGQGATRLGGTHTGRIRHEALGPVGLIVPWNFPLVTSAWKIAPALAAGCTAILKPSEITPLAELVYGDIAQEIGLPPGVLNIVSGTSEIGMALTRNKDLRKISFTGSNAVGTKVMAAAAARSLPVALELGGKSAIVVTEDADLDLAVDCVIGGIFYNAGQVCSATSRLLVHEAVEDRLVEALAERVRGMEVTTPFAERCDMGPITTGPQFQKVLDYIELAKAERCSRATGGHRLDRDGYFVAPTIYRDVDVDSRIWTEEIFGPVLATRRFSSDAEAIALANSSEYGLAASIVAGDVERAERIADELEAGHIWVNTPQIVYAQSAWGGFKSSGIGRELGRWGLHSYQGVKHVTSAA